MRAALEYNDRGCMLFSLDCPGAFARGADRQEALVKLPGDVAAFCRWAGWEMPEGPVQIVEEKYQPELRVEDADGDILFQEERSPLTRSEYAPLRALVLRSAQCLDELYASIPDKDTPLAPARETFYGEFPNTARKMFRHTVGVTAYYVGELGAETETLPGCYEDRLRGLETAEALSGFLRLPPQEGSYGEWWSPRKVLRRFLWHDRIHAKAMYRRGKALWGGQIANPFLFDCSAAESARKREKFLFLPEAHNDRFVITFDESGQAVRTPSEAPPVAVEPIPKPVGKYPCPCCGFLTFPVPKEHAIAYICPVCFWENDVFDPGEDDPSDENGGKSLRQGREAFLEYGAVRPDLTQYAREPRPEEWP